MKSPDELLANHITRQLSDDHFEEKVFRKIAIRRVRLRRMAASLSILALALLISVLFLVFPESDPAGTTQQAALENPPATMQTMEEVPVIENLYLASYDSQSTYVLEQVDDTESGQGI